ncbi:Benzene 1,2-dioxygenase subunit alpha [Polystyrenella longa]|uniref:Benzene 1,2-dioxygenase subunit alpha n=1 Tax=Polystyrenella longa TaxID=2528007 RepID=A0A518CLV9_9PLAN|nr:aromatic ring-hydroxylating dioxygenase subunit alpha [Polystyrenella longa]QDU80202.1 Benzene 1,2-dioxygenase subunit alpha [Polystyrenella longa]
MFIHKNQLEYQLSSKHYQDADFYQTELDRLFLPAWHLVCMKQDVANHGDFYTTEMFDRPIIIRNDNGELCAFLNVCSHRHCKLTNKDCGNMPQLKCQYHGWEYKPNGYTAKIPDARCFRPFDRENARLEKYRVETCGESLFICFDYTAPSLREFLGDFYDTWNQLFDIPRRHNWHWKQDFDCNWKIPLENTVETYHVPCVHGKSLGIEYPSEEAQEHIMTPEFTELIYDVWDEPKLGRLQQRAVKRLGGPDTGQYIHRHIHPHLVFTINDLVLHAQIYLPTSPTTGRTEIWNWTLEGSRKSVIGSILRPALAWYFRHANQRIQLQDKKVFGPCQEGVSSTAYRGCLGNREERIYLFQRYVGEKCGVPTSKSMSLQEECDQFKQQAHAPQVEEKVTEESAT